MGSKTFDGVWFASYSDDHAPPHVHGEYAGVIVVVELMPGGRIRQARRARAVRPEGAKKSDVRRILQIAKVHGDELMELWRAARG